MTANIILPVRQTRVRENDTIGQTELATIARKPEFI